MQNFGNCVQQNQSEIARLKQQMDEEREALWSGFYGLAEVARHQYINAKYRNLGAIADRIAIYLGDDAAMDMLNEAIENGLGTMA